jgi:hypothetical protein
VVIVIFNLTPGPIFLCVDWTLVSSFRYIVLWGGTNFLCIEVTLEQLIIIIIIWLYSPIWPWPPLFGGFLTISSLWGWIVSPAPNPQPGEPGLCIYDLQGQGGPTIPPGTGYTFYSPFATCMVYSGTIL